MLSAPVEGSLRAIRKQVLLATPSISTSGCVAPWRCSFRPPQHPTLPLRASIRRFFAPPPPPLVLRAVASSRASPAAGEREGPHRRGQRRAWGVPVRGARRAAVGAARRDQARVPAACAQVHPDVNKEANAQEKFLRIKHTYNTLMNSESRSKYASSNTDSSRTYGKSSTISADEEDQFYGFGHCELLENELKIDDSSAAEDNVNDPYTQSGGRDKNKQADNTSRSSFDDSVSEIETALEKLKKELGLS